VAPDGRLAFCIGEPDPAEEPEDPEKESMLLWLADCTVPKDRLTGLRVLSEPSGAT